MARSHACLGPGYDLLDDRGHLFAICMGGKPTKLVGNYFSNDLGCGAVGILREGLRLL